jgi:crotonobetainyl-CoA:carnitine CoA-transferase CaiB-like acyl-CoA transferase
MTSALEGIKVLDITGMGPASYAAQILGDTGAEVIKISQPPKNASRGVGQGVEFMKGMDASVSFDTLRNKKNVGINLKTETGHDLFSRMAETSDVIIESFRPGVMDRLGLGYEEMARINPRIIYCSVSGYGQDSPYRDLPGHDANYAGMGGALGIIGHSKDEPPVFAQNIVADFTTAILQAAIGILLAVCARERTGRGQLVDVSMTDGVLSTLNIVPEAMDVLIRGAVPKRGEGLFSGTQPWYSVYQTAATAMCKFAYRFDGKSQKERGRDKYSFHNDGGVGTEARMNEVHKNWTKWWKENEKNITKRSTATR